MVAIEVRPTKKLLFVKALDRFNVQIMAFDKEDSGQRVQITLSTDHAKEFAEWLLNTASGAANG
jgi:hypothetical protein